MCCIRHAVQCKASWPVTLRGTPRQWVRENWPAVRCLSGYAASQTTQKKGAPKGVCGFSGLAIVFLPRRSLRKQWATLQRLAVPVNFEHTLTCRLKHTLALLHQLGQSHSGTLTLDLRIPRQRCRCLSRASNTGVSGQSQRLPVLKITATQTFCSARDLLQLRSFTVSKLNELCVLLAVQHAGDIGSNSIERTETWLS